MSNFYQENRWHHMHLQNIFGQAPVHDKEKVGTDWGISSPDTAFLGPQFWDKKLSMRVLNHDWSQGYHHHQGSQGRDSETSSTPSPPRFVDRGRYDSDVSSTSNIFHTSDWKEESKFRVAESDLALATVPGVDFDPTKRSFTAEELKPQPIIKKRKKVVTPDNKKDDHYWAKRSKNNFAAKRSREARRLKENQIALRASYLEKENIQLKLNLKELHIENSSIRVSVKALMDKIDKIKQQEIRQNSP